MVDGAFVENAGYQKNIRPGWIGDVLSREHLLPGGAKIDAALFNSADAIKVIVGAAGAAAGAAVIPVDALPGPIPASAILNFGNYAPVVVTVAAGGADVDDVAIPVDALTGPIPAGTILRFGAKKFARLTANAAAGAVLLAVEALATALVEDDVANFVGGTKQARLTAAAVKGAVSLAVDELQFALVDDEVAYYDMPGEPKRIPASTVVGCTYGELEAAGATGMKWGPAADTDDIVRVVAYDIPDADKNNDCELLRPGTLLKVNFMPSWASLSVAVKNKIRAQYEITVGAPGDEVPAV
ncbi:MAG TPA: hypothetical protein VF543_22430 [Pyrinomonadaceae bacterium]|jgi:hypothetical protein